MQIRASWRTLCFCLQISQQKLYLAIKGNFKRSRTSPFLLSTGSSSSQCLLYRNSGAAAGAPSAASADQGRFSGGYHGLDEFKESKHCLADRLGGCVEKEAILGKEGLWQKAVHRKRHSICEELGEMHWFYRVTREVHNMQGSWQLCDQTVH